MTMNCPLCGQGAYLGFNHYECSKPGCPNYKAPPARQEAKLPKLPTGYPKDYVAGESPFQPGDKVRCIDPLGALAKGQEYTVTKLDKLYMGKRLIFLTGLPGSYFWDRFERA